MRERDENRVGWALALGIGAERAGGSWRRSEYAFEVEATRQLVERWLVEAKLGVARDVRSRRDSTLWALALEHAVSTTSSFWPNSKATIAAGRWRSSACARRFGRTFNSRRRTASAAGAARREGSIGLMIEF